MCEADIYFLYQFVPKQFGLMSYHYSAAQYTHKFSHTISAWRNMTYSACKTIIKYLMKTLTGKDGKEPQAMSPFTRGSVGNPN